MDLEKEMHVVIKLPFRRPSDFVEPPPVVWTEDMEHQLWKHINQKHTDWNYIAEQFGIPTPYLVRHAAFMYETQLRGIQQQLRLSEAGKPTTISSSPPPVVSTSTSSSATYRSSGPSSQRQVRPVSSSSTSSQTYQQQRNLTVSKNAQDHHNEDTAFLLTTLTATRSGNTPSNDTTRGSTISQPSVHTSPISRHGDNRHLMATHIPIAPSSSNMDIEIPAMATAPPYQYQHLTHDDSMMLSAISNVSPRNKSNHNNNIVDNDSTEFASLTPRDVDSIGPGQQIQNYRNQPPDDIKTCLSHDTGTQQNVDLRMEGVGIPYYNTRDRDENHGEEGYDDSANFFDANGYARTSGGLENDYSHSDFDDDGGFSKHFENMKLDLGEPAFLPSRRVEGSQLLSSLRASFSRSGGSMLSKAPSTTVPSSSSSISPTQQLNSSNPISPPRPPYSLEENQHQQPSSSMVHSADKQVPNHPNYEHSFSPMHEGDEPAIKTTTTNNDTNHNSSGSKTKMVFGPSLSRATLTQPSSETNKDTSSALSSVGSSFSDLSDYSVTQSAMEDAILSKLNNGSKMSSMAFSKT
ncbi:hypothetical protein BCR42DRAFT_411520 [Absidia repens]|uniref:Autophagy-related protein 29 n=1 Tax=Absidia repens TaxID=90262 RepID=A0A1X2ILU3_9FUNG|nr:hypothetical protein BCR42DRAFT_411520 [Absidia repens]